MARATKLKVYRTAAGFHDAYVAAPSQKAALAAWGSDHDLFARGVAELVTDSALTAEPLASPGTVVKRSRGTTAEQIAALPDRKPRAAPADTPDPAAKAKPAKAAPPKPKRPKPDHAAVDEAEAALEAVQREQDRAMHALAAREAALARERRALERERDKAVRAAEQALGAVRTAYDAALRAWRNDR